MGEGRASVPCPSAPRSVPSRPGRPSGRGPSQAHGASPAGTTLLGAPRLKSRGVLSHAPTLRPMRCKWFRTSSADPSVAARASRPPPLIYTWPIASRGVLPRVPFDRSTRCTCFRLPTANLSGVAGLDLHGAVFVSRHAVPCLCPSSARRFANAIAPRAPTPPLLLVLPAQSDRRAQHADTLICTLPMASRGAPCRVFAQRQIDTLRVMSPLERHPLCCNPCSPPNRNGAKCTPTLISTLSIASHGVLSRVPARRPLGALPTMSPLERQRPCRRPRCSPNRIDANNAREFA